MYHPRFKGSHYTMGLKLGTLLKKEAIDFDDLIHLDTFQQEHGKMSERILKEVFPEVCEEIRGLTDGLDYPYERFATWLLCMGCCYDPRGCTTFCFIHNDNVYLSRNNDLPPFLKQGSKSILYRPEPGNVFIGNTSSMVNLEEGLNEAGLAVAMEFMMPTMIKPGINSVFLVRYLIEKCASTTEAVNALQSLPIASDCSIILADKSGAMLVAECTPEKVFLREPEQGENFLIAANHFVSGEIRAINSNSMYSSEQRYQTAYRALKEMAFSDAVSHAQAILGGKHGFMCQYHPSLNFETIWSSVFDVGNKRVYRAEGDPSRVKFKEDMRASAL